MNRPLSRVWNLFADIGYSRQFEAAVIERSTAGDLCFFRANRIPQVCRSAQG
jgi:hypothetical protein